MATFYETLTAAVADITANGFDSPERMEFWSNEIRRAAEATMMSRPAMEQMLRESFQSIYRKLVERGEILKRHPGMSRFTLENLAPRLHAELQRRVFASADLIKLNRKQAIDKTIQRFSGWASSVPKGGAPKTTDKQDVKDDIRKSLAQLPFEERRVVIDQGHKFTASLSETIARGGNALAMIWHSHWRQAGYNYRKDHKERDQKVFALKGNWAIEGGLMKAGPAGYYDDITKVGEEPFCRCYAQWIYALRDLPDDMLTAKGKEGLIAAQKAIAAL